MREYEFRISAQNQMGRGQPSPVTSPIKIQESGGSRPEIVRKLFDVSSPVNKRVAFECEAIGRPTPTARW
uniref:Ig-like domain-containing protein n=1 Tax=Romanomermis culicivorax TaxID=13658 RepID=A0A915KIA7_ROMCU